MKKRKYEIDDYYLDSIEDLLYMVESKEEDVQDFFYKKTREYSGRCDDIYLKSMFMDCMVEKVNQSYEQALQYEKNRIYKTNHLIWEQKNRKEVHK